MVLHFGGGVCFNVCRVWPWRPSGPQLRLDGLWLEPWFLITLADLYLGVFMAIGFLWTRPGTLLKKMAWSAMFIVGGHPGVAMWHGLPAPQGQGPKLDRSIFKSTRADFTVTTQVLHGRNRIGRPHLDKRTT